MRMFNLVQTEHDKAFVVAQGVEFDDRRVALRWTMVRSTEVWDSIGDMLHVHELDAGLLTTHIRWLGDETNS